MKISKILLLVALINLMLLAGCSGNAPTAPSQTASLPESQASAPLQSSEALAEIPLSPKPAPITGEQIKDGTYPITVSSSSSMFKIIDAKLTVSAGQMTAVLTLSGDGYGKLYMGTKEQAAADSDDKHIPFVQDAQGKYTYTVPVAALNQETDVAAWSIKKETWYDRVLVFESAQIPLDAMKP